MEITLYYGLLLFLLIVVIYMSIIHYKLLVRFYDLKKELNTQTLDYYLNKVRALGYDFTIKPDKKKKR